MDLSFQSSFFISIFAAGFEGKPDALFTLAIATFAGGVLTLLARRLKVPTIGLLLIGGFILGPEVTGIVKPSALGSLLTDIVSLAVGVILFEGALTLNLKGYKQASAVIKRLLTVGVVITLFGTTAFIWYFVRHDFMLCLLAGSLVIVTGPTVIQPLLKRIRLNWTPHNVLHWEGVLIDPIGVFIAVLCFELAVGSSVGEAFSGFFTRASIGLILGYLGGWMMVRFFEKRFVPEDSINVFTFACSVFVFGLAEWLMPESGLLSVTVAGLYVGSKKLAEYKTILDFKATLTDLLIGMLFILLTARLEISQFKDFGWPGLFAVLGVMFVVRPVSIIICTMGAGLNWREKLFLCWVAPRGIVAASMSSLFALTLLERGGFEQPKFLESFVYTTIICTVLLQGYSAVPLAAILNIRQKIPTGWLIVGAHPFAREIARFLNGKKGETPVLLVDVNRNAVAEARAEGLPAIYTDARDIRALESRREMQGIGRMMALTDNEDLNELLTQKWGDVFKKKHVFHWSSGRTETHRLDKKYPNVIWSRLPKPSYISSEMTIDEARLVVLDNEKEELSDSAIPLIVEVDGKFVIEPGPEMKLDPDKNNFRILCLKRKRDYLVEALRSELIFHSYAQSKLEVLTEMVSQVSRYYPEVPSDHTLMEILDREKSYPTLLGHGVAVPHAYVNEVKHPICAIAILNEGVRFTKNEEEEPARLIFLVLSPPDLPDQHLSVLGEIARLMADETSRARLLAAKDSELIVSTIRQLRHQHIFRQNTGNSSSPIET